MCKASSLAALAPGRLDHPFWSSEAFPKRVYLRAASSITHRTSWTGIAGLGVVDQNDDPFILLFLA